MTIRIKHFTAYVFSYFLFSQYFSSFRADFEHKNANSEFFRLLFFFIFFLFLFFLFLSCLSREYWNNTWKPLGLLHFFSFLHFFPLHFKIQIQGFLYSLLYILFSSVAVYYEHQRMKKTFPNFFSILFSFFLFHVFRTFSSLIYFYAPSNFLSSFVRFIILLIISCLPSTLP